MKYQDCLKHIHSLEGLQKKDGVYITSNIGGLSTLTLLLRLCINEKHFFHDTLSQETRVKSFDGLA